MMLLAMLSEKLDQLEAYIEEIDQMKPIDVLVFFFESCNQPLDDEINDSKVEHNQFSKDVKALIHTYQQQGVNAEEIACQLYTDLLFFVRKILVLSYAQQLGIDSQLYKKQMDFLFKGKS